MTNKTVLSVTTEQFPEGDMQWKVEFPDLIEGIETEMVTLEFAYNNALYDLTAAVAAKLGVEMSKAVINIYDSNVDNCTALANFKAELDQAVAAIKVGWDV
jgi:hypothetical protein